MVKAIGLKKYCVTDTYEVMHWMVFISGGRWKFLAIAWEPQAAERQRF